MEKCIICRVSATDKPLSRTNPLGQPDAGWMCQDCIKITHPELYKNLKEEGDFEVTNAVFDAVNDRPLMTKNINGDKCPECGADEVDTMTPWTVYACGSYDYDQRPGTFKKSEKCKNNNRETAEPNAK